MNVLLAVINTPGGSLSPGSYSGGRMNESKCRSCGAAIIWVKTPKGSSMPLDALPNPRGNIVLDGDGCTGPAKPLEQAETRTRYMSHFATCPFAGSHRKKGPMPGKPAPKPAQDEL